MQDINNLSYCEDGIVYSCYHYSCHISHLASLPHTRPRVVKAKPRKRRGPRVMRQSNCVWQLSNNHHGHNPNSTNSKPWNIPMTKQKSTWMDRGSGKMRGNHPLEMNALSIVAGLLPRGRGRVLCLKVVRKDL